MWLKGGRHQRDVLVRVSCRLLTNGATVHVVLSDETPFPPLRIENRSSTQTLAYRLGGDDEDVFQLLEPMRWTALHWVEEKRWVSLGWVCCCFWSLACCCARLSGWNCQGDLNGMKPGSVPVVLFFGSASLLSWFPDQPTSA